MRPSRTNTHGNDYHAAGVGTETALQANVVAGRFASARPARRARTHRHFQTSPLMSRKSDEVAREIEQLSRDPRVKATLDHLRAELRALEGARARLERGKTADFETAILELTDLLREQDVAPERALVIIKSLVSDGLRDAPDIEERVLELFLGRFFLETSSGPSGPHSIH